MTEPDVRAVTLAVPAIVVTLPLVLVLLLVGIQERHVLSPNGPAATAARHDLGTALAVVAIVGFAMVLTAALLLLRHARLGAHVALSAAAMVVVAGIAAVYVDLERIQYICACGGG